MKKNSLILLIFVLVIAAQAGKVWVFLDGKDPVSTARVQNGDYTEFLNSLPEDNIARRSKIDGEKYRVRDLPVYSEYISSIESHGAKILGHSRWLNAVVIDESDIEQLKSLPFVLSTRPVRTFHRKDSEIHPEPWHRSFDTVHDL